MRDIHSPDLILGIVGAGAMGTGIAEVAAMAGIRVLVHDARPEAALRAIDGIAARLAKRVEAGKLAEAERAAGLGRLATCDELAGLAKADVVVEAIVEDLEAKRAVFGRLEDLVGEGTILATNTSSLPVGAIAAGLARPERVAGLHFFNPVPVMRLVEVIPGPDTTREVMTRLTMFAARLGRQPVEVRDTPGFLVNFGGRAYTTEALAILHDGVAAPAEIDAIMRDAFGFRMGPFELMDLTGIDVNLPVTEFIHASFFGDPRLRSTPMHRYMLQTGRLGRKSGRGFYRHDGSPRPNVDARPDAEPVQRVLLLEPEAALAALVRDVGLEAVEVDDGQVPILASPLGEDCAAMAARTGADYRRLVAIDPIGEIGRRVTVMTAPGSDRAVRDAVVARLAQSRPVTTIADSPGFVGQRIAAMVANLGCEMAQMRLARPRDIDRAMRLGLNYPQGPLELAQAIGPARLHAILDRMQILTGDDRYRPSLWLRRRAQLGLMIFEE